MHIAGGCDFERGLDLDRPSSTAPWTAAALPSVTAVTKAPAELTNPALALWGDAALTARIGEEHAETVVDAETLRTVTVDRPASDDRAIANAVLIPLDAAFETRLRSALKIWRALRGRRPGPDPAPLTRPRRRRLTQALQVLDARRAGAGYRAAAQALFGRERVGEAAWKTSPLRDQAIRLWRLAESLTHGGYQHLLLHPFRRRGG